MRARMVRYGQINPPILPIPPLMMIISELQTRFLKHLLPNPHPSRTHQGRDRRDRRVNFPLSYHIRARAREGMIIYEKFMFNSWQFMFFKKKNLLVGLTGITMN